MDFFNKIYEDCKQIIAPLFVKNIKLSKKVKALFLFTIILFVIVPITFNFLAMFELKYYTSLIYSASQVNRLGMDSNFQSLYDRVINGATSIDLPINNIKNIVKLFINGIFYNAININSIHLSTYVTYIGFSFKTQIFIPIFLWNIIPLTMLSILAAIKTDNGKINKVISVVLYLLLYVTIFTLYSGIVALILSRLCFLIFISIAITQAITVIISYCILIFIISKVSKSSKS